MRLLASMLLRLPILCWGRRPCVCVCGLKALPMHSCMRTLQQTLPPPPFLAPELATQFVYVRNMAPHHIFTFGRFVPPFVVCMRV